jgi:hypothetical protein
MIVLKGECKPRDGIKGCTFTVETLEEDQHLLVTLYSPYRGNGVVDQSKLLPQNVGEWLLDRTDY